MSEETAKAIEAALEQVKGDRRAALKRLLIGAGALALIPASKALTPVVGAQEKKEEANGKKPGKKKPTPTPTPSPKKGPGQD